MGEVPEVSEANNDLYAYVHLCVYICVCTFVCVHLCVFIHYVCV